METVTDLSKLQEAQHAFHSAGAVAFLLAVGAMMIFSLLGILYMTVVIAPNLTQRCSAALRERNLLSFLAGLPVGGGFLALLVAGQKVPVLGLLGFLAGLVALCLGYAAAAEDIGRRLYWASGKEGSRAAHLGSGWLAFAFGSLFPILGWCLIFPYVSLAGLGSILVSAFRRRPREIEYEKE